MTLTDVLRVELRGLIEVSGSQYEKLEAHYQMVLHWNQKLNLTTVTKLPEAATRHYGESLFLATYLTPGRVVDVGSGPGFPGIPAAILREDCQFTLVESHQRKAVFLREASRGLSNVDVRSFRAQDATEVYDWLVARAVNVEELRSLKLAIHMALLVGRGDADKIEGARVVPLPWGRDRVLAIVSRET